MSEQGFPAGVVREFAALFVPRRGHFGEHTEGGWLKRYEELTDALIAEHLRGERTFGVYPGHKEAGFVALECDFGEEEATPANVLELSARMGTVEDYSGDARELLRGARRYRKGTLRGYGNAIVPQVAAEFVAAYMEAAQGVLL